ncbi:cathepsin L [Trichonephila clavata]|uniref:Cathepsin L n=1 Tax=Trichonephila clavata TaxID=2740835 RepID=A0A8X6L2L1_TRICU|nr:cathepsin L [Trichonephila clavata]
MDDAFDYIKLHGIDTEESYPYLAKLQFWCYFDKEKVGATLTGYVDIPSGNEKELFKAVATVGPVSVGINAGGYGFMHYGSGIYEVDECDPQKLNHGVLIVGYGSEDGKDYWIVKNRQVTKLLILQKLLVVAI